MDCWLFVKIKEKMNNQNKQGGIDWTDYTWNPISGCLHGCTYCYLKRIDKRFKNDLMRPKFNRKLLLEPVRLRKKSKIFYIKKFYIYKKLIY